MNVKIAHASERPAGPPVGLPRPEPGGVEAWVWTSLAVAAFSGVAIFFVCLGRLIEEAPRWGRRFDGFRPALVEHVNDSMPAAKSAQAPPRPASNAGIDPASPRPPAG